MCWVASKTVHVRHSHVHQDQVRLPFPEKADGFDAIARLSRDEAHGPEHLCQDSPVIRFVVHNENTS